MPALKRLYIITVLAALVCVACSCNGNGSRDYAWVLATASPENTVTGLFANAFAEKVDSLSGGKMQVQVYHNSLLGGDTELIESCQSGDIPFVVQNTAPEVSYLPRLCLFDLPCVFPNIDSLHRVMDNSLFMSHVNAIYEGGGFHLLAMADQNFRVMTCNVPVRSMTDFHGIKIRTMENSFHMAFWSALGANPTPMAFSELYVGLEQHTIDAEENPYEVICSNGFYEVQKYVVETNHLPHLLALVTNNDFYRKLSDEQRGVVDQAAAEAAAYARVMAEERSVEKIQEIEDGGAQLLPVSQELWQDMRRASEPLYERIRAIVADDELLKLYTGEELM